MPYETNLSGAQRPVVAIGALSVEHKLAVSLGILAVQAGYLVLVEKASPRSSCDGLVGAHLMPHARADRHSPLVRPTAASDR
jgi:hypothetical protein